jgi:hypothetical protein
VTDAAERELAYIYKDELERFRRMEEALEGQHEYHLHGFAYYAPGTMGHVSAFQELCEIDAALGRTCHVASGVLDEAVKR